MKTFSLRQNGLHWIFFCPADAPVRALDVGSTPFRPDTDQRVLAGARLVELQAAAHDWDDHHGGKYTLTEPAGRLRYLDHRRLRTPLGLKLEIRQRGGGLEVITHLQILGRLPAFRCWTEVVNRSARDLLLEYVSSFAAAGLSRDGSRPWSEKMFFHLPGNTWQGECQWRGGVPRDFGLDQIYPPDKPSFSLCRVAVANQGSWSTQGHLPVGVLENHEAGHSYVWQIEHNGSWHWEVGDLAGELYLRMAGPTYREGLWSKRLPRRARFVSVPVTFGKTPGGLEAALQLLTRARRLIRTPHPDLKALPVIFNDYMNCLMGDPTTETLLPLVEKAAAVGCEYFVIDAGWYAARGESWWNTVGAWEPSATRFPGGLAEVTSAIRARGMVPGLWLEIEVMGIDSPLAKTAPDAWFFQRQGRRVIDHGRYLLDFRHPQVRAFADGVVERLVREFGVGYIKMDYNVNAGPGTDLAADAPGDGLLEHNRAYLRWVASVFARHPGLVIENCSSGGLRMDYAQLSVHSIQSVTDQTDYRLNGAIAAAAASAVTPEQGAIWSYPLKDGDEEETIFNMVNVLLGRVHQSGRLQELSAGRLALVREGIAVYKTIRRDLRRGLPFWPGGLPRLRDGWAAFGLDCGKVSYLSVWRLDDPAAERSFDLPHCRGKKTVEVLYPHARPGRLRWDGASGRLNVRLPAPNTARLIVLRD